ncbi:MAG: large-conductance mechanosensitive channel protein MscL [Christensenellales bacterium]
MFKEFKQFITKGNVLDLAVAVIIGGAVGKIVSSLVNDIIMPLIGLILGGINFSALSATIGGAEVKYGLFIQATIDFLIIAFCIFIIIKLIRRPKKEEPAAPPALTKEEVLLTEIRDLLKK